MATEEYDGIYFMTMVTGYAYASIRQLRHKVDTPTAPRNGQPQESPIVWAFRASCMSTVAAIAGVAIAVTIPPYMKMILPATLAAGFLVEITAASL